MPGTIIDKAVWGARYLICAACLVLPCRPALASRPCAKVDRRLSAAERPALEQPIAAEMGIPKVELLQSYRYAGWRVLYVATFRTDETFLFYHRDPPLGRSLTRWGGAARLNEQPEMGRWVKANAPGIPKHLAACWAWHVTQDRDL